MLRKLKNGRVGSELACGFESDHREAMKTVSLTARFDGQHIQLEEDYPLPKNARLLVTVLPEEGIREDWSRLATAALARAYGEEEPEYSLEMVREPNATYGAG